MANFNHTAFKIGIAVGLGLKGNYGSTIDTKVNDAFTKGVAVGQRLKSGVALVSSDGYALTDSEGLRLIAKGGV